MYIENTLNITVPEYAPFAMFNWLMPVINAACAWVGVTLKDMDNKPYKKRKAAV